ncbi:hypothetical protein HF668_02200 [Acidithiobacillus ferridurans]|uniref:hypothetical protein n=1 Tax=Acidithiobacillus ferridurans TaxID=1232575 RepID=UPI001C06E12F|nr:hypothetical protein [Acidithiobacillus ferridurans]MBU2803991.1 hypothetical protein [Acidithiobacillus ferridurans]
MLEKLKTIIRERRSRRRTARLRLQYYKSLEPAMRKLSQRFQRADAANTDEEEQ